VSAAGLLVASIVPSAEAESSRASATAAPRLLYASDWSGSYQIYAVNPSRRRAPGQLTFGRAPACRPTNPCGFIDPVPSPDGRFVAFWDHVLQASFARSLFIARADGTRRRRLAVVIGYPWEAVWAPDSGRLAYVARDGIHTVGIDGSNDRLLRASVPGDSSPSWSSDGRSIAFARRARGSSVPDLVVIRSGRQSVVASQVPGLEFTWATRANAIAYSSYEGIFLATVDSRSRPRRLSANFAPELAWSSDGKSLAFEHNGVVVIDVASGRLRVVSRESSTANLAWSPFGRRLAFASQGGVVIADVAARSSRLLTADRARWNPGLHWSPDGRLLAYVASRTEHPYYEWGDLRVVTAEGDERDVVAARSPYGGSISSFAWTVPASDVRYRRAEQRTVANVSADGVVAPWSIERLAADGERVAYVACGHVFEWAPASGRVRQAEPQASLSPHCNSREYYSGRGVYTLGVADDRVAFGVIGGGNRTFWWLGGTKASSPNAAFTIGEGAATTGTPRQDFVADLVGEGPVLVYSSVDQVYRRDPCCAVVTTNQELVRATATGCPCTVIASEPGPFVPHDVDRGRVVATGDNAVVVLEADGRRLLNVFVRARGAQLSASDLVVAVGDELRHYDVASGELRRTSVVPARASLQDVSRGLALYVLDGQVHLWRLADGASATVAPGLHARFLDQGLVVADGRRLRLLPFDGLPLG
jgi:Tol biopolymer transport system component